MLKLISAVLDVNYFIINEKSIISKKTDKSVFFDTEKIDENVYDDLILYSDNLFYNKNNECIIFNIKTKERTSISDLKILNTLPIQGKKGVLIDSDENLYIFFKDNFSKKQLNVKDYNWGIIYVDSNLYIREDKDVFCYGLNDNFYWQYSLNASYDWLEKNIHEKEPDIEKKGKIDKILGVYNNSVWLVLNSGWLLALDTITGHPKKYIQKGKMLKGESDLDGFKGCFKNDSFIDSKNGLIINFSRDFYIQYDLNSNEEYFESYNFREDCNKFKLNLNYIGGHDEKNIYAYEGSDNNRFAIFCREKKEIIWSDEIVEAKGKFPAIRQMKFDHKKLCILDYNNALNIYE